MKNNNSYTKEESLETAFAMYKETVSPSKDALIRILNQIPEIKELVEVRPAIRSPYIWLRVGQTMSLFVVMIALVATVPSMLTGTPIAIENTSISDMENTDPFYAIDSQINAFEQSVHDEDYTRLQSDYTL